MTDASLYMIGWGEGFQCMISWGGRTMLRDPAGGRIFVDERVEQTIDARVSDEYPHRRDPEREPVHDNIDRPQWCPTGLTRSQNR